MMRRLTGLLIVFALALPAKGVLSLYVDGSPAPGSVELLTDEQFTIQLHSSTASYWFAYLEIEDGGVGLLYQPTPAYGDIGWAPMPPETYWFLRPPGWPGVEPQAGIQWNIVYESSEQGSATISLYDVGLGYAMVDTLDITVVPEPVTLVLLGAGGAALLRKRRQ